MTRVLEAIYENGVLRPLEDPGPAESQKIVLELREPPADDAAQQVEAWHRVYEGLSDAQIDELEAIALDRSRFMARERGRAAIFLFQKWSLLSDCR